MTLPAFAAERRCGAVAAERACNWYAKPTPAAADRYLLPAGRSAANRPTPLLLSTDGTDRQKDRRTRDCFIDPVPHTMRVMTKNNVDSRTRHHRPQRQVTEGHWRSLLRLKSRANCSSLCHIILTSCLWSIIVMWHSRIVITTSDNLLSLSIYSQLISFHSLMSLTLWAYM